MLLEDLRLVHEDNERLEQEIAERLLEDPKHNRPRLARDHDIAGFLERLRTQSARAQDIYADRDRRLLHEKQAIGTGDPFKEFQARLDDIKAFHKRNPGRETENLERAYKRRVIDAKGPSDPVDVMFTGEEQYGRFFDLQALHETYTNLPGLKRRPNYLQYLDLLDEFESHPRPEKMKEEYFAYITGLAQYLEGFMRRIRPLEDLDRLFALFDAEFDEAWAKDDAPGWKRDAVAANGTGPKTQGTGEGVWCADCEKEFKNDSIYRAHLTGKKHLRAADMCRARDAIGDTNGALNGVPKENIQRLKEKTIAEREFRVRKLVGAMQVERTETKVNVERRQGMTEKERAQELEALNRAEEMGGGFNGEEDDEDDGDQRKSNPLHLPIGWDGKPIPYWLWKLHGLGVEYPCEICGNYVYAGRRAFDKHFSEARHLYGLKCLGITNSALFREITGIEEAQALWGKIQRDKKEEGSATDNVVQMEDSEGNVMPEKVYHDLLKAGLL